MSTSLSRLAPKFSLGSWAFSFGPFANDPWSFERVCRYAADAGYDGIEINGFRPHPHPDDYATEGKIKELKALLGDLGLGISGFAPDFTKVPPAVVPAAAYLAEVDRCLRFCERLGITKLRVDTVSPPAALPVQEYAARHERLAATWRQAAERCGRAGVDLVWEFEPGFWLNRPSEICRIVETVGHPRFGVLFDTSHAHMCAVVGARQAGEREVLPGGVVELARRLAGHIGHVHFIDSDGTLHHEETSAHVPFGEGHVDFGATLAALKGDLTKLEWWCFDFCFCPTTERDARRAIGFMRKQEEALQ
jgi:sugar phosphate isomerase/epimerase